MFFHTAFQKPQVSPSSPGVQSAMCKAQAVHNNVPSLSLLQRLIPEMTKHMKNYHLKCHQSAYGNSGNSACGAGSNMQCDPAGRDGPSWNEPGEITIPRDLIQSWYLCSLFLGTFGTCIQKRCINSKALRRKFLFIYLLPALPWYTFPPFALIPVILMNQFWINCQVLRDLG